MGQRAFKDQLDGWLGACRAGQAMRAPIIVLTAAQDAAQRATEIDAVGYLS